MKTAGISFLALWFAAVALASAQPTTAPSPGRLLAAGTDERFWIAVVGGDSNHIQTRLLSSTSFDTPWNSMPSIDAPAVSLAQSGGELLVVLDNGQWMIADEDSIRPGNAPPRQERVLLMADEGDQLWSLVEGAEISATRPSTLPTTMAWTTTNPTTAPAPQRVILYHIDEGRWINPVNLPTQVPHEAMELSMVIVGQTPWIAWHGDDESIRIIHLNHDGSWSTELSIPAGKPREFKLLRVRDQPALWIYPTPGGATTQPGTSEILVGEDFSRVIPLQPTGTFPPADAPQTMAVAFGYLRWLASTTGSPLVQAFDLDGRVTGVIRTVPNATAPPLNIGPYYGMGAVVVLVALAAALRQRRLGPEEPPISRSGEFRLRLAPLGSRLAAGMVDALPILAAASIVQRDLGDTLPATLGAPYSQLLCLGLITYLMHTLVAEAICGQTIGKMLLGLRVVDMEGRQAYGMPVILRNLLRIFDLAIIPLLPVFLTPLHQRIGDLAGGTVVISTDTEEPAQDAD